MPEVYDNWERLVEAILKREELRQLALCSSFSSCTSDDSSCPSLIDFPTVDLTLGPSYALEPLPGVGKRGFVSRAAHSFAGAVIMHKFFSKTKQELLHPISQVPYKLRRFSLQELIIATDNFNSKNLIGEGACGAVYKGRLKDGSLVAVKRCRRVLDEYVLKQFYTEVEILSKVMHRNLLRLHGFCVTSKERVIVSALMVNGSVASYLRKRPAAHPPLDWSTRKRIALGSARGLEFLHHCNRKVIHFNITASNILLDVDFEPVVGDFGLAMLMDRNATGVIIESIRGTVGYIAPEIFFTSEISEKIDVFSYGAMLLELFSGQRECYFAKDDYGLPDWAWKLANENKLEILIDPDLEGNYVKAEVESFFKLAIICTNRSPEKRPEMLEVVEMLEGGGGLAERWDELQNDSGMQPYELSTIGSEPDEL